MTAPHERLGWPGGDHCGAGRTARRSRAPRPGARDRPL